MQRCISKSVCQEKNYIWFGILRLAENICACVHMRAPCVRQWANNKIIWLHFPSAGWVLTLLLQSFYESWMRRKNNTHIQTKTCVMQINVALAEHASGFHLIHSNACSNEFIYALLWHDLNLMDIVFRHIEMIYHNWDLRLGSACVHLRLIACCLELRKSSWSQASDCVRLKWRNQWIMTTSATAICRLGLGPPSSDTLKDKRAHRNSYMKLKVLPTWK